jgi:branched-chain amino acid transport system substrate-binding protein
VRDSKTALSAVLVAVVGLLAGGCSLSLFEPAQCESNSQCRAAFGRGWTCVEDGLCSEAEIPVRCSSEPDDIFDDLAAHEDWILVGNLFDFGDFQLMQRSARLAVIQVNTRDGLDGTKFGMIECTNDGDFDDDGLDENEATEQMAHYMSDVLGLPAIVGPATSTRTEIAYNTSSPLGTLHISPSATSPALTAIDGLSSTDAEPGLLWRTAPPDSLQGQVTALEMIARGIDRVGVAAEVGAYGEGLAQIFQEHFNGDGRTSDLSTFTENSELGPIAAAFNASEYDAVLAISAVSSDVADFLNAASSLSDYPNKLIFLADGAFDIQMIEQSESSAEDLFPNVLGTIPATPSGLAFDTFVASYFSVFDQDPTEFGFSAHAYDAAWLAIAGAAWSLYSAEAVTGLDTARGLRKVSSGDDFDTGPNDWNNVKAAFEDGQSVDLRGASGSLDFDPETGETAAPVNVWTIVPDGGTWALEVQYCVDVSASPAPECVEPGGPEEPEE